MKENLLKRKMSNWIYVCEKNKIDLEDLLRFDHEKKTYCIYHIKEGFFCYLSPLALYFVCQQLDDLKQDKSYLVEKFNYNLNKHSKVMLHNSKNGYDHCDSNCPIVNF